jgi:hypothetical protein
LRFVALREKLIGLRSSLLPLQFPPESALLALPERLFPARARCAAI